MTHKRSAAVIAETAAAKSSKIAARDSLPSLEAYAALKNPNSKQVEEAINLIAAAIAHGLKAG